MNNESEDILWVQWNAEFVYRNKNLECQKKKRKTAKTQLLNKRQWDPPTTRRREK